MLDLNRRSIFAVPAAAAAMISSVFAKVAEAATPGKAAAAQPVTPAQLQRHEIHTNDLDLNSAQAFLTGFRKFVARQVNPVARSRADAFIESKGLAKDADMPSPQAYAFMLGDPVYAWASRLSVTTQQLTWQTLLDHYHGKADFYLSEMERADKAGPGTLELNPDLKLPEYTRHEIHIQPGGYVGDPFAGHVYHVGTKNFYQEENDHDEIHAALAADIRLPADGKVRRVLDLGCGIGQLTTACKDRFPDAEVWGLDAGGPMVRYSHMRATKMNSEVHFAQRLAEDTKFPDNHFDIVTSYIMFHEVTQEASRKIIAEAHRILRPGGVFIPFDFVMPRQGHDTASATRGSGILAAAGSYAGSRMNGEPFLPQQSAMNFPAEMRKAGFALDRNFEAVRAGRPFTFPTLVATKQA
jgi:ubiquinone/menaquinone biosynthesis C-methylase UbiE